MIDSSDAPVRFERSTTMLPLPKPVHGGSVEEIRPFLNASRDDDWRLMLCWLLFTFQPLGPFPILVIQGEQGSAKTTTSRMLRMLIDPSELDLRSISKNEEDLMVGARRSRFSDTTTSLGFRLGCRMGCAGSRVARPSARGSTTRTPRRFSCARPEP